MPKSTQQKHLCLKTPKQISYVFDRTVQRFLTNCGFPFVSMVSSALSKIKNAPLTRLHGKKTDYTEKRLLQEFAAFRIAQWFPTGGPQADFRWAMAPFRSLICSNSLSGGEKYLS